MNRIRQIDLYLIRHSLTQGNLEKRYVGTTDEDLCKEGIQLLKKKKAPFVDKLFVSPMQRCLKTASILFQNQPFIVKEGFRECDFGAFEYKNYLELAKDQQYQQWIDSNGTLPFPKGESREEFISRCVKNFQEVALSLDASVSSVAFVVHGGTIMSILESFALPKKSYFDWQTENSCGFLAKLKIEEKRIWIEQVKATAFEF